MARGAVASVGTLADFRGLGVELAEFIALAEGVLDAHLIAQLRQIARIHFLWCDIAMRDSEAGQAKHGRSHDCFE